MTDVKTSSSSTDKKEREQKEKEEKITLAVEFLREVQKMFAFMHLSNRKFWVRFSSRLFFSF
jgi:hypothetical protein